MSDKKDLVGFAFVVEKGREDIEYANPYCTWLGGNVIAFSEQYKE